MPRRAAITHASGTNPHCDPGLTSTTVVLGGGGRDTEQLPLVNAVEPLVGARRVTTYNSARNRTEPPQAKDECALETEDFYGVEIVRAGGPFHGVGSPKEGSYVTHAELQGACDSYRELDGRVVAGVKIGRVKLGHGKQTILDNEGLPAAGWLENLRMSGDRLVADVRKVPRKVAELMRAGAYRFRSIEFWRNWLDDTTGQTHPFVITGMALLGAEQPAVSSLSDIIALYADTEGTSLFVEGAFAVSPTWLPIAAVSTAWDPAAAQARVWEWAGVTPELVAALAADDAEDAAEGEGDENDGDPEDTAEASQEAAFEAAASQLRAAYLYWPDSDPSDFTEFRYLIADVLDGELTAVPNAIFASAATVGTDATISPADRTTLCQALDGYYSRLGRIAPWGGMKPMGPYPSYDDDYYAGRPGHTTMEDENHMKIEDIRAALMMDVAADETAVLARIGELVKTGETLSSRITELEATPKGETFSVDEVTQLRSDVAQGRKAAEDLRVMKRDALLEDAVKVGKIDPAALESFQEQYDAAPEVVSTLLASLAPNVLYTTELGHEQKDEAVAEAEKIVEEAYFTQLMGGMAVMPGI